MGNFFLILRKFAKGCEQVTLRFILYPENRQCISVMGSVNRMLHIVPNIRLRCHLGTRGDYVPVAGSAYL